MAKILVYDVKSLPKSWSMRQMADTVKNTGYCVYDSNSGGEEPTTTDLEGVQPENGVRSDVKIITLEQFEKLNSTPPSPTVEAKSEDL